MWQPHFLLYLIPEFDRRNIIYFVFLLYAMAKAIEDAIADLQCKDADKTTPAPVATATPAPAATATPAPAATATPAPAATATPQYTIPQTGDTSNPALLVVLMLVSGSAAIGTAVVGSKKKHNR